MQLKVFLLLGSLCAGAYAAEPLRDMPPAPPPPAFDAKDGQPEEEPPVTITEPQVSIKELRIGGRLYAIKITPKHGKPYYLVDDLGDGKFARQESLDSGVRVPRWVLKKF
jgi:hypothetical protein